MARKFRHYLYEVTQEGGKVEGPFETKAEANAVKAHYVRRAKEIGARRNFVVKRYRDTYEENRGSMAKPGANPKRSRTTGTTVPAHVRINPRTGRIQVFVTPKVAEKLRGGKGIEVAGNPGLAPPQGGASRIPVKLKYTVIDSTGKSHSATTKNHAKTLQKVLKVRGLTSKVVTLPKGSTTWNT